MKFGPNKSAILVRKPLYSPLREVDNRLPFKILGEQKVGLAQEKWARGERLDGLLEHYGREVSQSRVPSD